MKKAIFTLTVVALMLCLFTLAVGAERVMPEIPQVTSTYYLVQSADSELAKSLTSQGLNVVAYKDMLSSTTDGSVNPFFNTNNFAEGSHIEVIFAEDIFVPQEDAQADYGILINQKHVVTFRFNGFSHVFDCAEGTDNNGIFVNNSGAVVRFIGTKAIDGENGSVSSSFIAPAIANGVLDMGECNLDVYKAFGSYIRGKNGQLYVENLRGTAGVSVVYTTDPSNYTYYVYDCAMNSISDWALRLEGTSQKVVYVDNGYYDGFSAYSAATPSTVKGATITNGIHIDSWPFYSQILRFEYCDINVSKISSATGRTHYVFYLCTMNEDIKWSLSGDNGGNQFARIYTAPTCTTDGTITIKRSTNKGNTPIPEAYQAEMDLYNASNRAFGHIENDGWYFTYEGAEYFSSYTAVTGCPRCGEGATETKYGDALMTVYGYSASMYNSYSVSFFIKVDRAAIANYESIIGKTVEYGFIAAIKDSLGEGVSPLDENGDAAILENGRVLKIDTAALAYSPYLGIKVTSSEEKCDTELLICAYIIEKGEDGTRVSYIQENDAIVSENGFAYVSYGSLTK